MSDIGKGDWVIAVRNSVVRPGVIIAGNVYHVAGINSGWGPCDCQIGSHDLGLYITGVPPKPNATDWCPDMFKPLGGNATSITRRALKCEPVG